ncbi:bifunctional diguanylate cyclase/phosphodiesterase [Zongyangia hominis]|uniref:EAL domain-containing protein n=1 Tax=Zongyangia hominis TaxID=2763677 RepID=A0A926EAJ5_9FIRM|nr:EAL domain-containing protein [Zongyangia hominis]MBC8569498.1 EAL domain-containing protein [Zongyangia hominis]
MIVLIIMVIVNYTQQLDRTFEEEAHTYLNEISRQAATFLHKQITAEMQSMRDLANYIGDQQDFDLESALDHLRNVNKYNGLKRMGIIVRDGTAYTTDDQTFYLGDREYFNQALQGKDIVSDTLIDKIGGGQINVCASPIYHDGRIVAVLFATHRIETYEQTLSVTFFGGQGYAYVANTQGDIMLCSSGAPRGYQNVLEFYRGAQESENPFGDVVNDMQSGENGFRLVKTGREEKYICYNPVDINDWYVFFVTPQSVVSSKTSGIMNYTMIMCGCIVVAFILLFLVNIRNESRSRARLANLAYSDPVTGIRNLAKFRLDAQKLLDKAHEPYAVIQFDVDKFKYINDVFGYSEGNRTLRHIAHVLSTHMEPGELCARSTNDHFVLMLHYQDDDSLLVRLYRLCEKICAQEHEGVAPFTLLLTFGIYRTTDELLDIVAMLDRASIAQKSKKGFHQTSFAFYNEELRQQMIKEKNLENEMTAAMQHHEFVVYYQPKYYINSLKLAGSEALVRWNHPERGLIPPGDFVPLFEKNGFIVEVDLYVFESVCQTIRRWLDEGLSPLPVSVNISRLHLHNPNFLEEFVAILKKYEVPANLLEFELTESVVFDNVELLIHLLHQLHRSGFLLSMDDFGTGYSSLNMLKDIPVDVLKLDRAFFEETDNDGRSRHIVTSVVALMRSLGIKVVAEGVETASQLSFLKSIQCDIAQGYYLARPMPLEDFEALIRKEQHSSDPPQ